MWASWCGSCRSFSRILIPLYHKYKDRGFIIVGIAREKSVNDVLCALALEKYPWMQFVELEDKNSIWLKHGIENAGGGVFLVDDSGKIAAINPTIEELVEFLERYCGQ